MKTQTASSLKFIAAIAIGIVIGHAFHSRSAQKKEVEPAFVTDTIPAWNVFVPALIQTESNGNPNAIGKRGDVGILQITPIYVQEANRIGKANYALDDRFDPEKSLEMFNIINDRRNPDHDIYKAMKLHNPGAGRRYREKVLANMYNEAQKYAPGNTYNGKIIIDSVMLEDMSIALIMQ